ncbi:hypothetical protein [Vibrio agarivorans]|uniref:hypothetical protein n=1 Tax=Vibrio agarivorans TaxID=153622 RepID=UPI002231E5CD|nr:hypothetical protein [Vibrio agarivorans]MDN3663466.1 hypothetical protein [Vibrio agarivorans]
MKYVGLGMLIVLLAGCGSDSGDSPIGDNVVSGDDFKKDSETVVDSDTGITYEQIIVDANSDTTISLKDSEVFSLTSGDEYSEKLVVQGNLTIK